LKYLFVFGFFVCAFAKAQPQVDSLVKFINKEVDLINSGDFDQPAYEEKQGYKTENLKFYTVKGNLVKVKGNIKDWGYADFYYRSNNSSQELIWVVVREPYLGPYKGNVTEEEQKKTGSFYFKNGKLILWKQFNKMDPLLPEFYFKEQLLLCVGKDIQVRWATHLSEQKFPGHFVLADQLKSISEKLGKQNLTEKVEGVDAQTQLDQKGSYLVVKRKYKGDSLIVLYQTEGNKNRNESETQFYYKGELIIKLVKHNTWGISTIPNTGIQGTEDKQTTTTFFYKKGVLFRTETEDRLMRNYMDEHPSFIFKSSVRIENY
jgi:hypothetical protein